MRPERRRICFVTGTRAEFGLMQRTLRAIEAHPELQLQIIATGMHLDRSRGRSINEIRSAGFDIDAVVPWRGSQAVATGLAMSGVAEQIDRLKSDLVLVVGDRVEAFAAAGAAHLSGKPVAHVHGGDRAQGQIDDALRHAITKLAHLHLAATAENAARIVRLGEDRWRVRTVGAPGIDGIRSEAAAGVFEGRPAGSFVLLVLHPTQASDEAEFKRAALLIRAVKLAQNLPIVVVFPNNDPGAEGIARCWRSFAKADDAAISFHTNLSRRDFLAAMRDAALMIGNSSAGIIEAASLNTPVIDVGDRQAGRLRSKNTRHVRFERSAIENAIRNQLKPSKSGRVSFKNAYGGHGTAMKIARILSVVPINRRLMTKLIAY